MATYPLTDRAILLRPEDDVAIAKKELAVGHRAGGRAARIEVRADIKPGHKVARHAVRRGDPGAPLRAGDRLRHPGHRGSAITCTRRTSTIGELVGRSLRGRRGRDAGVVLSPDQMRYFDGYKRDDGRVGTRNYVAIISA
jgi:altronate hydrolase